MLEVRVLDDLRSTIELSFHKENVKIIVEYDGDIICDVFTGLDMLYFKDKQLLSVESLIGTILTTEESTSSICGSLFSISMLYQLCEQSMSIMNVMGFLQVCRCFVPSLHIHPTNNTIRNPQMLQKIDAINNSTGNTEQPSSFIWCLLLLAEVLGMHAVFHECIKKLATILQQHISKQISSSSDTISHQHYYHTLISTSNGANVGNINNDGSRVKRAFNMSYLPRPVTNIPGINMDASSIDSLEKRLLTHLSQYTSLLNLSLLQAFKRKQIGMRNNGHHDVGSRSSSSSRNKTAIITPTSNIPPTYSNNKITNKKSSSAMNSNLGSTSLSDDYFHNIGSGGGTVSNNNTTVDNSDVSTINSSTKATDKTHRDLLVPPSSSSSAAVVSAEVNSMHHLRPTMNHHSSNADSHHDHDADADADEESLSEDKDYSSDRNHDHLSNPSIVTDVTDISDLSMTPIAHYMKKGKSYHSDRKRVSSTTTDSSWIPSVMHTHAHHTTHDNSDDHHRHMSNKYHERYKAHYNHNHHNSHRDDHSSSRHYKHSVDQIDRHHQWTNGSNNNDDYDDVDYGDDDDDGVWSRPKYSPTEPVSLHPKSVVYNYQGHYRPSSNDDNDDDDANTIRRRRWSVGNREMDDDRSRDYPPQHQHTIDRPYESLKQHNISNIHHHHNSNHHHHSNHHHDPRSEATTIRSISPHHERIRHHHHHHHQSSSTASTLSLPYQRGRSPGVVAFGSSTPRSLVDNDRPHDHHLHQSHNNSSPMTASLRMNTSAATTTSQDYSDDDDDHHHHSRSSTSPYHRSTRSKTTPTSANTPTTTNSSSSSSSSSRRNNRSSNNNNSNNNSNTTTTTTSPSPTTTPPQLPSQMKNHHHHPHNHHHHHSAPLLSPDDLKMSREIALLRLKEVKVREDIDASKRQAEAEIRENRLKALELKTAALRMKASPSKTITSSSSNIATVMVTTTTTTATTATTGATTATITSTTNSNNSNYSSNYNNYNRGINNSNDEDMKRYTATHTNAPTTTNVDTNININDYSNQLALKSPLLLPSSPFTSHQGNNNRINRIHSSNSDGHVRINEAIHIHSDAHHIPNTSSTTTTATTTAITHSPDSMTSSIQPRPLSAEQARVRAVHRIRETRRAMEQQRMKEEHLKVAAKNKNRDKIIMGRSQSTGAAAGAAVISPPPPPLNGNAVMNGSGHQTIIPISIGHDGDDGHGGDGHGDDDNDDDNESSRLDQALFGKVSENNRDHHSGKSDDKGSRSITTTSPTDHHTHHHHHHLNSAFQQSKQQLTSLSGHSKGQSKPNHHQPNYRGTQTSTFPPKDKRRDNNFDDIVNSGFYSMEALHAVGLGFSPTSIRDDDDRRKNDHGIISARGDDMDGYHSQHNDDHLTTTKTTADLHTYDVFPPPPPPPPPLSASMTDQDFSIAYHRNDRLDNSEYNHHHQHHQHNHSRTHNTSSIDHPITPTLDRSLEFQLKEEQLSNNLPLASSTYPIASGVHIDHSQINNYHPSLNPHRHQQINTNTIINSATTTYNDNNTRKKNRTMMMMMDVISIKIIRASQLIDCLGGTNAYIVLDWGKLGKASTQAVINSNEPFFGSTLKFRSPYKRVRRKDIHDGDHGDDYRDGNILDILNNSRGSNDDDDDGDRGDEECLISHAGPLKVLVYNRNHSVSDELIGSGEIDVHEQLLSLYNKIIINNNSNNNNNNINNYRSDAFIHDSTDTIISTLYLLHPSGNYKTTRSSVGFIEYTTTLH